MYHDLIHIYWWDGMKKDIADYVAKFPNYQQVKAEPPNPGSLTQITEVSTLKWETNNMDFMVGLLKTKRQHDSIWVIVEKMTMSANFIPEVYLQSRVLCETLH